MARATTMTARKTKKVRATPHVRRGKKVLGPSFLGYETWTDAEYHANSRSARAFYYENYKVADLLPDAWAWMKENKYSVADIRAAKAQGVGVNVAILCKLLRGGMPDYNKSYAEYWESLPGTGDKMEPVSTWIVRNIDEAIRKGKPIAAAEKKAEDAAINAVAQPVRQNIQEIMRERAGEASAEIEAMYDEFVLAGSPKEFETRKRVMAELTERKILPQHVSMLIKPWERIKAEYIELQDGKDEQLKEGYARFSKMQIRNMIKIIDQIISDLSAYISIKQATKAKSVRTRKPVPIEKIVAKLKYLKTFKDEATKVDLTSLHPSKLHGASEAWVYDTSKRKLHHLVADEYSKTLGVKGNTILGFDTKESEVKTLRKPAEQIKAVMGSRPAARKFFKSIKAVATCPNGRFNDKMVILKVY